MKTALSIFGKLDKHQNLIITAYPFFRRLFTPASQITSINFSATSLHPFITSFILFPPHHKHSTSSIRSFKLLIRPPPQYSHSPLRPSQWSTSWSLPPFLCRPAPSGIDCLLFEYYTIIMPKARSARSRMKKLAQLPVAYKLERLASVAVQQHEHVAEAMDSDQVPEILEQSSNSVNLVWNQNAQKDAMYHSHSGPTSDKHKRRLLQKNREIAKGSAKIDSYLLLTL
ncbi:hypothetical protein BD560DRAFT_447325 [Blakeslea trispora]|nr:hypothetical protein BD560DRAFT_447325 [Blakeslea trispora]